MKPISSRDLLTTFGPSIPMLILLVVVHLRFGVTIADMTEDVASIGKVHPLSGFLSTLGILTWCATTSICAFAAMTLGAREEKDREAFRFLVSSALLTGYLLLDDCFLFHEELAMKYLNWAENVDYVILAVFVSVYFVAYRRLLFETKFPLLIIAIGFLGVSAVCDGFLCHWLNRNGNYMHFVEDGCKWLGIVCWCSYYTQTSYQLLHQQSAVGRGIGVGPS